MDAPDSGAVEPSGGDAALVDAEDRKRRLANQVRTEVTQGGRIESQGDFDAVIATGKEVNHTVHLIATLATCGLWGIVWLVLALTGGIKRKMVSVDNYGQILIQHIETK